MPWMASVAPREGFTAPPRRPALGAGIAQCTDLKASTTRQRRGTMSKIGFIGMGIMGRPMAGHLLDAGRLPGSDAMSLSVAVMLCFRRVWTGTMLETISPARPAAPPGTRQHSHNRRAAASPSGSD